jgi:hypothetical protein
VTATAPPLLPVGTHVRWKACRDCIEAWITARRLHEDRGIRWEPTVLCSSTYVEGIVQPYDMRYCQGTFPVRCKDGIWRMVMAADVRVVGPGAATLYRLSTAESCAKAGGPVRRRSAGAGRTPAVIGGSGCCRW